MRKPLYTHDCQNCTYLGIYNLDDNGRKIPHDLYYCHSGHPTVIARYGDDGGDYQSGLHCDLPELIEAKQRARDMGLLKAKPHRSNQR